MTIIIFGFKIKILFLNKRKIVRILILGAGKMGRWLSDSLCLDEETAVFDTDKTKLKYLFNVRRLTEGDEIRQFDPELVINAAGLSQTENAFRFAIPFLSEKCILSDIASVKNNLEEFYRSSGFRFASSHPMFGPTAPAVAGRNVVVADCGCPSVIEETAALFSGATILRMPVEDHDPIAAYVLGLSHAVNLAFSEALVRSGFSADVLNAAASTTFRKQTAVSREVSEENAPLYYAIQRENPYNDAAVENLAQAVEELRTLDKDTFCQRMQAGAEWYRIE